MPTLTIQLPGQPPVSHVLKDETITIGRMKGNTIVIEDGSISLMHAKITRKDGQFYLKDLNSTNGTFVNGQPVGEVRLRDQDRVRFAEITTQFVADGEVTSIATAAPVPVAGSAPAPVALPSAPVSAAVAAPAAAPAKVPAAPAPKSERKAKTSRRALLVAAAIVIVALPGIGFVVWKTVNAERQSGTTASALVAPKSKKAISIAALTPPAAPAKPAAETKPVPDPVETTTAVTLNVADLVSGLKSADATERRQAASALHGAGTEAKDAIPALKEALKDSDTEVQMWAALALVNTQTYDKAVIPILVRALKNDNTVLRQVACLSLGLIPYEAGDKEIVVPALTEAATKDATEEVRQAAKSALNIVGAESSTQSAAK